MFQILKKVFILCLAPVFLWGAGDDCDGVLGMPLMAPSTKGCVESTYMKTMHPDTESCDFFPTSTPGTSMVLTSSGDSTYIALIMKLQKAPRALLADRMAASLDEEGIATTKTNQMPHFTLFSGKSLEEVSLNVFDTLNACGVQEYIKNVGNQLKALLNMKEVRGDFTDLFAEFKAELFKYVESGDTDAAVEELWGIMEDFKKESVTEEVSRLTLRDICAKIQTQTQKIRERCTAFGLPIDFKFNIWDFCKYQKIIPGFIKEVLNKNATLKQILCHHHMKKVRKKMEIVAERAPLFDTTYRDFMVWLHAGRPEQAFVSLMPQESSAIHRDLTDLIACMRDVLGFRSGGFATHFHLSLLKVPAIEHTISKPLVLRILQKTEGERETTESVVKHGLNIESLTWELTIGTDVFA